MIKKDKGYKAIQNTISKQIYNNANSSFTVLDKTGK